MLLTLYISINLYPNYFDSPTKLCSDLYLAKFLNTSAKLFFPCTIHCMIIFIAHTSPKKRYFIIKDKYVGWKCTYLDVDFLKNGWRWSLTMSGSSPTSDSCGSAGELQIPRRQANRDDVLLKSYHPR